MPNSRANAVEGESTRLKGRFTNSGALYDPFSMEDVNLYAEDPTANPSAIAIATITPSKEVTGLWYVDYTFNTPGIYYDKWRYESFEDCAGTSEVVERVVVNTLPTETEKDWTLLATWVAEYNKIQEAISDNMTEASIKDGSLNINQDAYAIRLAKRERYIRLKIMELDPNNAMITEMGRLGVDDNT